MASALPPSGGGDAVPTAGAKGDVGHLRFPMSPLDTPLTFRWPLSEAFAAKWGLRGLGSVRRAGFGKPHCPEFALRKPPRITVRGQTVQGGSVPLRKAPLRSRGVPWSRKRPCGPLAFRRATGGSRVQRKGQGSQEGTGNHTWCPVPFCPCRWAPTSLDRGDGQSNLQRCAAVSAEGLPSADGKEKEGAPSFESARQVNR